MPIYKMDGKKDGKQKYRVRINYVDNTGKSRQIDRVAYGKEEAKDLERQLTLNLREETAPKMTLQQLYDEYVRVKKHEIRESSLDRVAKRLKRYVLGRMENYKIDKLTIKHLQDWKISLEDYRKKNGKPLALKTKQDVFADFKGMLRHAVKMEYISKNPFDGLENFKDAYEAPKKISYYTDEEFKKFISGIRNASEEKERKTGNIYEWNFYVFFMLAFYTGMRKGEICALRWNDISDNTIHITRSITQKLVGDDRETPPKNKHSIRDIQMPIPLIDALEEHKKRFKEIDGFSDSWYICGGIKPIRDSTLAKRNTTYAESAGLPVIRIHDFRHSHASLLANESINIQEIARRLGHSNVELTWNTYAHLYPREEERALKVLNKIV